MLFLDALNLRLAASAPGCWRGRKSLFEDAQERIRCALSTLKVIASATRNAGDAHRFESEPGPIELPGIAQIYNAGTAEALRFPARLRQELIHGKTLLTYCESHQLNSRENKVCEELDACNMPSTRTYPCDLKRANILVDRSRSTAHLDLDCPAYRLGLRRDPNKAEGGQLVESAWITIGSPN